MVDRSKVLSGLKSCADSTGALCRTCPYDFVHNENCMGDMARDALELLTEQQKQKFFVDSDGKMTPLPIQKHGHWIVSGEPPIMVKTCSECNIRIFHHSGGELEKFCAWGGAKMDEGVKQE